MIELPIVIGNVRLYPGDCTDTLPPLVSAPVMLPLRIVSVQNESGHWAARAKRVKQQRECAYWVLAATQMRPLEMPSVITLTRIAPRPLDSHDNLRAGFKAVVDGVADWLGIKDNDPRVTWQYAQEKGKPKEFGVRIEFA